MADRKVTIALKVNLVLRVDEGEEICNVINELEYSFKDGSGKAQVEDESIEDYEIVDSK